MLVYLTPYRQSFIFLQEFRGGWRLKNVTKVKVFMPYICIASFMRISVVCYTSKYSWIR